MSYPVRLQRIVLLAIGLAVAISASADHSGSNEVSSRDTNEALAEIAVGAIFGREEQLILGDYLRLKRAQRGRDSSDPYHDDDYYDDESYYRGDKRYRDNYRGKGKPKKLPPGLRKKLDRGGQLPPGWQMKVDRGEVIDDDIYRNARLLPEDIIRQISYIEGTSIREIDNRIVRIQDATRTILDVFYLIQDGR